MGSPIVLVCKMAVCF